MGWGGVWWGEAWWGVVGWGEMRWGGVSGEGCGVWWGRGEVWWGAVGWVAQYLLIIISQRTSVSSLLVHHELCSTYHRCRQSLYIKSVLSR